MQNEENIYSPCASLGGTSERLVLRLQSSSRPTVKQGQTATSSGIEQKLRANVVNVLQCQEKDLNDVKVHFQFEDSPH